MARGDTKPSSSATAASSVDDQPPDTADIPAIVIPDSEFDSVMVASGSAASTDDCIIDNHGDAPEPDREEARAV